MVKVTIEGRQTQNYLLNVSHIIELVVLELHITYRVNWG